MYRARRLHPDPNARTVPEQLVEAHRYRRRNGLLAVQDVVERLWRYAEKPRNLGFTAASCRNHDLRKTPGTTLDRTANPVSAAMVVRHVDLVGVSGCKASAGGCQLIGYTSCSSAGQRTQPEDFS